MQEKNVSTELQSQETKTLLPGYFHCSHLHRSFENCSGFS